MGRLKEMIRGAFGGSGPSIELREALEPLRLSSKELYERAVGYTHCGAEAGLLLNLEQAKDPELDALLIGPGRLANWYQPSRQARATLATAKLKPDCVRAARGRFYGSAATPGQFVRFGRLLAAIATGVNRTVEGVPGWLTALLNDVTGTFSEADVDQRSVAARLPAWRAGFVPVLAADAELPDPETVALLALCQQAEVWGMRLAPHLLPGMDDFLAANGSRLTPQLTGRLNAAGRTFLAERAEQAEGVGQALAQVVADLALDGAKGVRTAALRALATLPVPTRNEVLPTVLARATAARATDLVEWLGRDCAGAALLDAAVEAGARIGALVDQATQRRAAIADSESETRLELPPFEPLPEQLAGEPVIAELRRAIDAQIAKLGDADFAWAKQAVARARSVTRGQLEELVRVANGQACTCGLLKQFTPWWIADHAPSLDLIHLLRLWKASQRQHYGAAVRRRADADTDLRVVADAAARAQVDLDPAAFLDNPITPEAAWPWFADQAGPLVRWLAGDAEVTKALRVLAEFPALPAEVVPKVAAVALGDSRPKRLIAQQALLGHRAAPALATQGLTNSKGEIRAAAADWLATQGDPAAIGTLRAALEREKREVVRAALLTALEKLGEDISADVAPAVLLAEAKQGLKSARPASMSWFNLDAVPGVRWADGSAVDPAVVAWWCVLAVKLKDPDGSGLIDRYLSRLHQDDAASLGRHALRSWIAQDTRRPAEEESRAYAATSAAQQWQNAQTYLARTRAEPNVRPDWLRFAEDQAARSVEELTAAAFREHQSTYLGSAVADKGLLALTTRLPGIELADAVQTYIRNHPGRRAQVEHLVTALYGNGQPAAVQLLLSISRRFKQATVQAKALELVERVAQARGWTPDELADRTIPTAGFSTDRLLHLSYGRREFLGRVTAKATIQLSDADGKLLKALPGPRADDDGELVAEAKKQLTSSRKELKAVLGLQAARLYEAMCTGRTWAVGDWNAFLAGHPLMSGLISRLIWLENPGPGQRAFRPTEDGELIGADDEPVDLAIGARIAVAHRVLLAGKDPERWRRHLADYATEPLFDQLGATSPEITSGATELTDLRGHLTDTFRFRGVAAKRGYARGNAEDGGWFEEYTKEFSGAGLVAEVRFTGSYLPEENIACATESLRFLRRGKPVPLSEVPPVLVAECYADYAALAALGPYDPDYQQKAGV